jgi:large subunit ribosomal protein L24e
MPVCSFCKENYPPHKGLTIFTFDGRAIYYCSSKCRRNVALKRDPKKTLWVKKSNREKKETQEKNMRKEIEIEAKKLSEKKPVKKEKKVDVSKE